MFKKIIISEIEIVPVRPRNGLVAFASCVMDFQFYIGCIAIYTSPASTIGYRLLFPTKNISLGKQIPCFFPINKISEQLVSNAIISEYVKIMSKLAIFNK